MQEALKSNNPPGGGMSELLNEAVYPRNLRRGDIVEGQVVRVDKDGLLISVGQKTEGIVPVREMRSLGEEAIGRLRAGEEILAYVLRPDSEEGIAILSIDKARSEQGWRLLQKHVETKAILEAQVTGYNKGGLLVDIQGVQGFVPMSQLPLSTRNDSLGDKSNPLAKRVGEVVRLRVLELDRAAGRVILSEKAAVQEDKQRRQGELLEQLQEGQLRRGRVTGLSSFGAFVDIGGADGLIHVSELAWQPVASPDQVLSIGQEVEVKVIKVDREQKRIALSLKRTQPEPWDIFMKTHNVGDLIKGTVTRVVTFGAFVRVEGNVEGLVHVSELTDRPVHHPKEAIHEGEELTLKIVKMEPEKRRLGLSLRQALHEPWDDAGGRPIQYGT